LKSFPKRRAAWKRWLKSWRSSEMPK
jgi:hypothetical protein